MLLLTFRAVVADAEEHHDLEDEELLRRELQPPQRRRDVVHRAHQRLLVDLRVSRPKRVRHRRVVDRVRPRVPRDALSVVVEPHVVDGHLRGEVALLEHQMRNGVPERTKN